MKILGVARTLGLAATAIAQIAQYCPSGSGGVCYRLNVPDQTASSGNGDIFFQIQGPLTKSWIAVGQGTGMAGSDIFVIYPDETGTNVTLSPRLGKGYGEPLFNGDAQAVLIEGSGITNGLMTANIRCSSCGSWSGGSMDFTSSKASWIWAVQDGSPLKSDSQSATLSRHTSKDEFQFDLTKARGGNSLNPFAKAAISASTANNPSTATPPSASNAASTAINSFSGDDDSSGAVAGDEDETAERATIAHGVVMSLAFVIIFPFGALVVRLCSFKALVWVHAGVQLFGYVLALTGLGLGIFIAVVPSFQLNLYHPIIGIIVIAVLVFQPFLGLIHHRIYRTSLKSTFWSVTHVWLGRIAVSLGIINGGLGLRLADNTKKGEIAYGIVVGLVWVVWVIVVIWKPSKPPASRGQ